MAHSKTTRKPGKTRNKRRGITFKRVCDTALKLPGIEVSTSYGTPSLKVHGRILARLRSDAEGALVLKCDFLDRAILLQTEPTAFFVTDHHVNYPLVLVHLDRVQRSDVPYLIERAWRMLATPRLVAQYERRKARVSARGR